MQLQKKWNMVTILWYCVSFGRAKNKKEKLYVRIDDIASQLHLSQIMCECTPQWPFLFFFFLLYWCCVLSFFSFRRGEKHFFWTIYYVILMRSRCVFVSHQYLNKEFQLQSFKFEKLTKTCEKKIISTYPKTENGQIFCVIVTQPIFLFNMKPKASKRMERSRNHAITI